jgi:hypothetical protein
MNYGQAIGGILGTALIVRTINKHLIPKQRKIFKQIKSKGGKKRR